MTALERLAVSEKPEKPWLAVSEERGG